MINHREERIAMMRFFVEIHRIQKKTTGGDLTTAAVLWIVALGHLEGKPFNASSISAYLDIPRSTVTRKLQYLCAAGLIDRRSNTEYCLSARTETMPEEDYAKVAYAIQSLAEQVPVPKTNMATSVTRTSE